MLGVTQARDNTVMYSDGLYHDPGKEPAFHSFLASYNLRRLGEVISSLRWENFRLKERLTLQ